jgi:hypothetical protein
MATAKMETAAERYKRIREKREKGVKLFDVECKDREADNGQPAIEGCGMVWKARREPLDYWVTSGILPSSLASKLASQSGIASAKSPNNLASSLRPEDLVQGIDFTNKIVLHTAVEPRIVTEEPGANDVLRSDVMTCCYNTLVRWQMSGGDEGDALATFPRKG